MAKEAIANPTVTLGLDSTPLTKGLDDAATKAAAAAKKVGEAVAKTGPKVKQEIQKALQIKPGDMFGAGFGAQVGRLIAAAVKSPLNALKITNEATSPVNMALELLGKANRVLGAPVRALMARESDQAHADNQPILNASSTTMTAVFARLSNEIEQLAADALVGLDKAFNFRAILEGFRGVVSGVRSLLAAAFGPLVAVVDNPNTLQEAFKQGQQIALEGFKMLAEYLIDVSDKIVKLSNVVLQSFNALMPFLPYSKSMEEKITAWQEANAKMVQIPGNPMAGRGGINPLNAPRNQRVLGARADAIKALGFDKPADLIPDVDVQGLKAGVKKIADAFVPAQAVPWDMAFKSLREFVTGLGDAKNPLDQFKNDVERFAVIYNDATAAAVDGAQLWRAFRMKDQAQDAFGARLQGLIGGTLQTLQSAGISSRITSAAEVGSSALVEAIVRASAQAGSPDDIQKQIKAAIELQLEQQRQQTKLQRQIFEAARSGGLLGLGRL
jgi:hypothetical protein